MADDRQLILILGGARSGKSRLAEELARRRAGGAEVLYVATAEAGDEEMRRRVAEHRRRRPATWRTLEEPRDLARAIPAALGDARVVVVDCATLWLTNLLLAGCASEDEVPPEAETAALAEVDAFLAAYRASAATFIVVSNEVGLGLVPPYPLGRAYRDLLGRANQRLAAAADAVYLLIAGLPLELKALSRLSGLPERLTGEGDGSDGPQPVPERGL